MNNTRVQSSTSYPISFFLALSVDHLTGATGKTPTVTISKNGGSFGSASGAVTEIGNGWYSLAANATDRNTIGDLLVHATATGCDPLDEKYFIIGNNFIDKILEPSGALSFPAAIESVLGWLLGLATNKITQTNGVQTLRNNADNATIATAPVSDNGTTFTRGKFS